MAGKFVVRDTITGEYLTSSQSKTCDPKDVSWAKIYSSSGAKSASSYYQRLYDHWYEQDKKWQERDPTSYQGFILRGGTPLGMHKRNFVVEEI